MANVQPPPAPRRIPPQFARRVARADAGFGLAFAAVGGVVTLGLLLGACAVPLMLAGTPVSLLFVAVGGWLASRAWTAASKREAVLRDGDLVPGAVVAVVPNGDRKWRLDYAFSVDGAPRRGQIDSTDAEITRFEPGSPVQVVVLGPDSDIWPPLG